MMTPTSIRRSVALRLLVVQLVMSLWFGYLFYLETGEGTVFPFTLWSLQCMAVAATLLLCAAGLMALSGVGLKMITVTEFYQGPAEAIWLHVAKRVIWLIWLFLTFVIMHVVYLAITHNLTPELSPSFFDGSLLVIIGIAVAFTVLSDIGRALYRKWFPPKPSKPSHLA